MIRFISAAVILLVGGALASAVWLAPRYAASRFSSFPGGIERARLRTSTMAIVLMSIFVFSGGLALAGVEPWLAVIIPFFSPIGLIALFAGVFIEAHINEGRLRAAAGSPDALAKLAAEREARQAKQWQTQIDRLKLEFTIVPGEGIEARFEAAARRPRHGIFSTDSFTGRLVATPGDTSGVDRSRSPDIEDATFGRGFL